MSISRSDKGFTLLELMAVIVIVGILAYLGFGQYRHVFEKARAEGAKQALWEIRVAWGQYVLNSRDPVTFAALNLTDEEIPARCRQEQYFRYDINSTHAIATRCTTRGKPPQGPRAYRVELNLDNATWSGTPGYY